METEVDKGDKGHFWLILCGRPFWTTLDHFGDEPFQSLTCTGTATNQNNNNNTNKSCCGCCYLYYCYCYYQFTTTFGLHN